MKYIITEQQLEKIKENVLKIPFDALDNDWDLLQKFLSRKGNPPYIIIGDLNLYDRQDIKSLGSLIEVRGDLDLRFSSIESLGNLTSVGGYLSLRETPIKDLGNLTSVETSLDLIGTSISKKYTEEQIRDMVEVGGDVYL